ncbi:hypothetical protein FKW77_003496 [Venturia effusa]|uniref:Fungal N-terminal domain-containing protein n=1 Tax=Venturia effusa TaxID=50376 RepID=A0A517LNN5_9PEZI|nr:hypothetical protein FKW77_003496 [Venturia effusa]
MVFPFGVSVGDFIAGINIILDCVKAVDDVTGATTSYQQLVSTLDAISQSLRSVDALDVQALPQSQQQAIKAAATACLRCTNSFLRSIDKYGSLKTCPKSSPWTLSSMKTGLKKINWSLNMKDDVSRFQRNVTAHLTSLEVWLSSVQIVQNQQNHNAVKDAIELQAEQVISRVDHKAIQLISLAMDTRDRLGRQSSEQGLMLEKIANQQQILIQATSLSTQPWKDYVPSDQPDTILKLELLYRGLAEESYILSRMFCASGAREQGIVQLCALLDDCHMYCYGVALDYPRNIIPSFSSPSVGMRKNTMVSDQAHGTMALVIDGDLVEFVLTSEHTSRILTALPLGRMLLDFVHCLHHLVECSTLMIRLGHKTCNR